MLETFSAGLRYHGYGYNTRNADKRDFWVAQEMARADAAERERQQQFYTGSAARDAHTDVADLPHTRYCLNHRSRLAFGRMDFRLEIDKLNYCSQSSQYNSSCNRCYPHCETLENLDYIKLRTNNVLFWSFVRPLYCYRWWSNIEAMLNSGWFFPAISVHNTSWYPNVLSDKHAIDRS